MAFDQRMAISDRTAEALAKICQEVRPRTAVDLGTGTGRSMAVMAEHAPKGGVIWTVDNDPQFIAQARGILKTIQHRAEVHFIHARIQNNWYSVEALTQVKGPVDLLFVDGPVGAIGRGLALPTFLERLAPGAHVYLDDFNRTDEQNWFGAWVALLKEKGRRFRVLKISTERGLGGLIIE